MHKICAANKPSVGRIFYGLSLIIIDQEPRNTMLTLFGFWLIFDFWFFRENSIFLFCKKNDAKVGFISEIWFLNCIPTILRNQFIEHLSFFIQIELREFLFLRASANPSMQCCIGHWATKATRLLLGVFCNCVVIVARRRQTLFDHTT